MPRPQSQSRPFTLKSLIRFGVALPLWLGLITLPLTSTAAVFDVTTAVGLYAAIATANSNNEDDTINLQGGTYLLTGGELSLAIDGNHTLEIKSTDAGGARTTIIDGNNTDRVFAVSTSAIVTISDVTITNGNAAGSDGGGISCATGSTLILNRCTISNNEAGQGAGIYAFGSTTSTINGCTITGNIAGNGGGGFLVEGAGGNSSAMIVNSTISDNASTSNVGGGLSVSNGTTFTLSVTVSNCTIFGNSAIFGGGINLANFIQMSIKNTVVAGNTASTFPDFLTSPATLTSQGYNLFGTAVTGSVATDITLANPANHGVDPVLAYNPATATVQTHKLLTGSPAIDAVGAGGNGAPATDQVGQSRHDFVAGDNVVDIGAFELQSPGSLQFGSATFSVNENGGSATITVTRIGGSSGTVTVFYATSNGTAAVGSDYTASSGILTFAAGVTTQTFSVPIFDDALVEPNESVNVALSNPTGGATLGTPSTAVLTIVNDDVAGTLQFGSATFSVNENGGSATITATRTGGSAGTITVNYATSDGTSTAGSDYTASGGTLTFAASVTSQTFTVPLLDDPTVEPDETVNLTLSNPTEGATLGTPNTAVLTIVNNDVSPTISSVTGPANGSYRAGQNLDFSVTFDQAVIVSTAGGTPIFGVTVGSTSRNASYSSGSGAATLVFRYTVQAGDTDSDGIASASPIVLNGGTIRNAGGTDAALTFAPPTTTGVLVDTTVPTVTVNQGGGQADPTGTSPINFTVVFSEPVTGFATGGVSLSGTAGATTATVTEIAPNNGTTYNAAVSGMTGPGTVSVAIVVGVATDTAGNASAAGTSTDNTVTFAVPPSVSMSFTPNSIGVGLISTLKVTIDNTANVVGASNLAFTNNLPAGLIIANPAGISATGPGGLTGTPGTGLFAYTGGQVAANSILVVSVNVVGSTPGVYTNTTGNLTSNLGNSGTANASLKVNLPPTLTMAFSPTSIALGGVSTLTFTINNSASTADATDLNLTGSLPIGMTIAATPNATTGCTGGTLMAVAGATQFQYTSGTVLTLSTCTVSVDVMSKLSGASATATGNLTSNLGVSAATSANLAVVAGEVVPTLTEWGIIALTLILALAAVFRVRRSGQAA